MHVTAERAARRRRRPRATVTEAGLRNNVSVGIQYLEAWLRGNGAVGINNLMEDAATAEISRSQVWQWLHNDVELDDGQTVTRDLVERLIDEEMAAIRERVGDERSAPAAGTTPAACSPRWRWPTTSPTSSPSRPTSGCREASAA